MMKDGSEQPEEKKEAVAEDSTQKEVQKPEPKKTAVKSAALK